MICYNCDIIRKQTKNKKNKPKASLQTRKRRRRKWWGINNTEQATKKKKRLH